MTLIATRTFAARNEQERLMAAFADLVYEQGYELTRLVDVAGRTGISPEAIAAHWASEEDCAIDTLKAGVDQVVSHVTSAVMQTAGDDGPAAAHHALGALLQHVAGMPEMLHLAVIELPVVSDRARHEADRAFGQFADFLGPGFAALSEHPPDRDIVTLMIGGGIQGILRQHALERRTPQLPDALGAISYVCISTFFGRREARRVLGFGPVAQIGQPPRVGPG